VTSFHPWFPTNRSNLDRVWRVWSEEMAYMFPPVLAPRVPPPYGKPVTLVIDSRCLYNEKGKRPGMDKFLGTVTGKFELIVYADQLQDFEEIDVSEQLTTYQLGPDLVDEIPKWYWKNPRLLNRPLDSTILVDCQAENAVFAPNNALILPEWDGFDIYDNKLTHLIEILDFIAKKVVVSKMPVYDVCPHFQSIDKDVVGVWKEKTGGLIGKLF